ncbi:hypothetical protein FFLO_04318 [Filobasidium floriforme]|uniref:Uncharacterized protein n=1 Tax=Filobasidium floriforme TaxID=5210 RepID=A0A8K0JL43_9TREE|nr:hypothetical protein FFLO_04318 [Filobasidium floriforme]
MPRPAEASDSLEPLSDFNFDFDLDDNSAPASEALQSPVLAQPASTAKVKEAPSDREAVKGNSAEKHQRGRGIRSRLRARLKKPDRWNVEPGPRQTWSRENFECWLARRAARSEAKRTRDDGASDQTSIRFSWTSASSATNSEESKKEVSVGSLDGSENGSESPADSSSETSERQDRFDHTERPRPVESLPVENVQPRQSERRGRFPRFSRSRPRPEYRRGLFGKLRRRKESGRIID